MAGGQTCLRNCAIRCLRLLVTQDIGAPPDNLPDMPELGLFADDAPHIAISFVPLLKSSGSSFRCFGRRNPVNDSRPHRDNPSEIVEQSLPFHRHSNRLCDVCMARSRMADRDRQAKRSDNAARCHSCRISSRKQPVRATKCGMSNVPITGCQMDDLAGGARHDQRERRRKRTCARHARRHRRRNPCDARALMSTIRVRTRANGSAGRT